MKHGRHRTSHSTHQPESLDWFNVLIAQAIAQYRQTAYLLKDSPTSSILGSLAVTLNNPEKKPSFIGKIKVTDISLGEEFPIFSNCRVISVDDPTSDGGRLQALMDVDLSDDNMSLAVETSLILNYPKPFSAVLPVALSVSVVRFSGTLCISFIPGPTFSDFPPDSQLQNPPSGPASSGMGVGATPESRNDDDPAFIAGRPKTNLAFSFLPDYRLDLSVRSLIGSRSRLQDVPKVAQLVEARVQAWFEERVVEPRVQVVGLPGLWPRMGRTGVRSQEEEIENGDVDGLPPVVENYQGLGGSDPLNCSAEGLRYRAPTDEAGPSRPLSHDRPPEVHTRGPSAGESTTTSYRVPGLTPYQTAST